MCHNIPSTVDKTENRIPAGIPGGFFVYSAVGKEEICYADQNVIELFGCKDMEEFRAHTGNSFTGMVHPDDLERVERSIQAQTFNSGARHDYVRYRIITKQGECRFIEDFGHLVRDVDDRVYYYVFIVDVKESEYLNKEHNSSAELQIFWDNKKLDWLTGLLNMEAFYEKAASFAVNSFSKKTVPCSIIIFDILGMREINRTLGHDEGDKKIRSLVEIIQTRMPEGSQVFRGHEADLIVVCRNRDEKFLAEYILDVVATCESTILFGIATSPAGVDNDKAEEAVLDTLHNAQLTLEIKKMLNSKSNHSQALSTLIRTLEEVDPTTQEHVLRTQKLGLALGHRIGLSELQLSLLQLLCLLHDIGKVAIPLEILNKPSKLTNEEWDVMKSHAEKGYHIAKANEELTPLADMILSHHERWDGKGYPNGLSQEEIPILSRIIAIVDAYDAMVNDRCYRKALSPETAKRELRDNASTQFDPGLVTEFLSLLEEHPELAAGEKTSPGELQGFRQAEADNISTGSTSPIEYSQYTLDLDDHIIEIDKTFEKLTGYSRSEVIGKMTQYDLIPDEERGYYTEQVRRQFIAGNIAYLRHPLRRKDGTVIQVVCNGKRHFDSSVRAFRSTIMVFEVF